MDISFYEGTQRSAKRGLSLLKVYHWRLRCKNSILMTCHYTDLGRSRSFCQGKFPQLIRSITQFCIVTPYRYGISSAPVSQTSFAGKPAVASQEVGCFLKLHHRLLVRLKLTRHFFSIQNNPEDLNWFGRGKWSVFTAVNSNWSDKYSKVTTVKARMDQGILFYMRWKISSDRLQNQKNAGVCCKKKPISEARFKRRTTAVLRWLYFSTTWF